MDRKSTDIWMSTILKIKGSPSQGIEPLSTPRAMEAVEEALNTLKWTTEKPTQTGWYWVRWSIGQDTVEFIEIDDDGVWLGEPASGEGPKLIKDIKGIDKWSGPIKNPDEEAIRTHE